MTACSPRRISWERAWSAGAYQKVSQPGGPGTVVYTPVVQLTTSGETTAEDGDPDTEFTLDIGLIRGMTLGNLVWQDTDDDGIKDAGETGINGVSVQVCNAGADGKVGGTDDVLLQSTTTASGGLYSFNDVPPVTVYVRLPLAADLRAALQQCHHLE